MSPGWFIDVQGRWLSLGCQLSAGVSVGSSTLRWMLSTWQSYFLPSPLLERSARVLGSWTALQGRPWPTLKSSSFDRVLRT